jgi:hypothetical protein
MRRWLASAVVLVAVASAPLSAELKITSKMVVRPVAGAAPAGDMMSQMMAPMMIEMFGGTAGIEMVTVIAEDGRTRVEYKGSFAGMPAGTVMLMKLDGTSVGYDPKAGTWWKMPDLADLPPEAADLMAQMKPEITMKRTGEMETIAGLRAERSAITMRMPIPLPPEAAGAPPEILAMIPQEIRMDGDMWIAPTFRKYSKAVAKALTQGPMAQMGFDKLMEGAEGMVVKQVMRMSLLAGHEMETVMLAAVEEAMPATTFELPAGLKEIPMPTGGR